MKITDLPALNASLNALCATLLVAGLVCIRTGRTSWHRRLMVCALITSALFLVSYVTYHFSVGAVTRFQGQGWIRPLYFTILISHTILAVAIVPLVILTVSRAIRRQFDRHRAVARWTWPLWLYVSVTGVVIYWMLYQL
jgi:uncharacterized membrane protein YozB (DUF420 family)